MTAFVAHALRTAAAPRGGAFARIEVHELAAPVLRRLLAETGIAPEQVDEVILSNALGGGGNPARLAALAAGLPERVAGLSIDRQCCGGLDAILLAARLVESGAAKVVLAGGAESYSRRPIRLRTDPDGGPALAYDRPPFSPFPDRDPEMHAAAAALARSAGISREEQEAWAVESHARARAARDRMRSEIVEVPNAPLDHDSFTRNLTPRFAARAPEIETGITSATAAVAADAAGFALVVAGDILPAGSRKPLAIVAGKTLGAAPEMPATAPIAAIKATLAQAGVGPGELTVTEMMEAYAVQAMVCVRDSNLPRDTVNLGGGALARGHPVGASGAILAVRAFHEMQGRRGYALAAIAAAGGIGTAALFRSD